jgi:hypothetical protein
MNKPIQIKPLSFPIIAKSAVAAMLLITTLGQLGATEEQPAPGANPIIRDVFTADPAPVVIGDMVYLYVGHDNSKAGEMFTIPDLLCFSSKNMKNWTAHSVVLSPTKFVWTEPNSPWAALVIPVTQTAEGVSMPPKK